MKKIWVIGAAVVVVASGLFFVLAGLKKQFKIRPELEITQAADPDSLRVTPQGTIIGYKMQGAQGWLGIPYTTPLNPQQRWFAAKPPQNWLGTFEARKHGSICPQIATAFVDPDKAGTPIGREDCLYLNVFAPSYKPNAIPVGDNRLPVMVWIHGGANTQGSSNRYSTYALKLAGSQKVVVVTINYRLGVLGWFRHAALHEDSDTAVDRSGNYGTLDIIESLRWVQKNIASFGGNPGNVTVFGESAGGRNVFSLLASPLADGLFHKAISQSGAVGYPFSLAESENLIDAEQRGVSGSSGEVVLRLLQKENKAKSRDDAKKLAAKMNPKELGDYLKSRTVHALLLSTYHEPPRRQIEFPNNFPDGTVLRAQDPVQLFRGGDYNRVPMIAGSNKDEQKLFLASNPEYVWRLLGIPRIRDLEKYNRVSAYVSDLWKARAVDLPLQAMAEGGTPVFGYRFDWDEEPSNVIVDLHSLIGAAHAMEIPFVFNAHEIDDSLLPGMYTEGNLAGIKTLSEAISSYWAQFAYTGAPGKGRRGDLPEWKPWSVGSAEKYIILDTSEDKGIRMGTKTFSVDEIKKRLVDDVELLGGQKELCKMYNDRFLTGFSKSYGSLEEYNSFGPKGCATYPPLLFEDLAL